MKFSVRIHLNLYHLEKYLLHLVFWLLTRYQIQGQQNMPEKGPLLILANHLSVADPPAIGIFLPRRSIFMAKEELFKNKVFGYFIKSFGAFPVYRGGASREALRQAAQVLKDGQVLVMFPEGKRSLSGGLQLGLPGSALIAYHNKATILPVAITGTEVIRGGLGWIWQRPKVKITIGPAFELPESGHSLSREKLSAHTELIMQRIAALLPEKYRGYYKESQSCQWKS